MSATDDIMITIGRELPLATRTLVVIAAVCLPILGLTGVSIPAAGGGDTG